jgi:vanillate O-demethylase monooxygenase subunit
VITEGGKRMFLRNHGWYMAAWGDELGEPLMQRWIAGDPVVFYRTSDGRPVALADRCLHRRAPLSAGVRIGDEVRCGYHGFTYDCTGACTEIPGQKNIPASTKVHSYPLVERYGLIWIWMGDPDRADPGAVPDLHWFEDPEWARADIPVTPLAAHYSLLIDNLLDLAHETYIHPTNIGNQAVAETPVTSKLEGTVVTASRHMNSVEVAPFYHMACGIDSPVDRWQDFAFEPPGTYLLHSRNAPAGLPADEPGFQLKVLWGITPETETTTHVFLGTARNFAQDRPEITAGLSASLAGIALEDVAMLEKQQIMIATDPLGQEVSVKSDAAGLHGRRLIKELLAQEAAGAEAGQLV